MASIFHVTDSDQASAYLGFFGESVNTGYNIYYDGDIEIGNVYVQASKWNLSVALNMIPIIGNIIAGIMHLRMAYGEDGELVSEGLRNRGIAELTIIGGIALAIGDIIVTVGRMCTEQPLGSFAMPEGEDFKERTFYKGF